MQPIILPQQQQRQNPYIAGLQNMLMQMFMMQQGAGIRGKEREADRQFALEQQGYTTQAPLTGMQMKEGQIPSPAVTVGEKGYYTPKMTVETKQLPNGQTAYFLKQGPKTTGFSVTKPGKPEKSTFVKLFDPQGREQTHEAYYKEGRVKIGPPLGAGKPAPESKVKKGADPLKTATTLRGEFIKGSKTFTDVRDSYRRVEAAAIEPSAAGDLALIFNYMKILDPASVVRESEFANAEMSRALLSEKGVPSRFLLWRDKIMKGTRLTEEQRADFVGRAKKLYDKQETSYKKHVGEYRKKAVQYQVDPEKVIVDLLTLTVGKVYHDESGNRMRFMGYSNTGEEMWGKP